MKTNFKQIQIDYQKIRKFSKSSYIRMIQRTNNKRSLSREKGVHWDRITAISSVFIATASFFVAWISYMDSNRANKLNLENIRRSVTPVLIHRWPIKEDQCTGTGVKNFGIGPAKIKKIQYYWDSLEITVFDIMDSIRKYGKGGCVHNFDSDFFIPAGEQRLIVGINGDEMDGLNIITHIEFKILYESNFGDTAVLDTR